MFRQGEVNGHAAVWIENEVLRLTVLPQKGADIFEFIHKPSGVDFMMRTPTGLQPPGAEPQADYLANYEGAWQELFPNTGGPCEYRGKMLPMHGEVALLPWTYTVEQDDAHATAVRFTVRCGQTPFRLERLMRLRAGESTLEIEGRVTNEGDEAAHFVWGHHIVLGGDFLEGGCVVDTSAQNLHTPAQSYKPDAARLAAGQQEAWPFARGRHGEQIDLRQVPPPEIRRHDDCLLSGLARGEYTVTNPRLGLRFDFKWDLDLFPTLIMWQPYGGLSSPAAIDGAYGLGLEPWVAAGNLEQAIANGTARLLAPGAQLETRLSASVSAV